MFRLKENNMNFHELTQRLRIIENGGVAECMPIPLPTPMHSEPPKQQDNVTMNVSMNGSGAGGIKDLMNILRNIEHGGLGQDDDSDKDPMFTEPHHVGSMDAIFGDMEEASEPITGSEVDDDKDQEEYANRPDRTTYNIDTITRHGDDIHSKGDIKRLKVSGGENPLQESLVEKLSNLYNEIKLRESVSTMHRHHADAPKVDSMEHEGHGEFTATVNGENYHVYAPIDFGSSHDDIPEWLGSVDITGPDGNKLHHSDPIFRAIDDELDKVDPADLGEYDQGAAIDSADYAMNPDR
jgi:hypothetical protein